jgi:ribulose-phosphate 3-epimerase
MAAHAGAGVRREVRRVVPRVAASVLSADCTRLAEDVTGAVRAGADWVHLDVMDAHGVSNATEGPLVCEALRTLVAAPLEVHLMLGPADAFVPAFARAGADLLTFHPEESEDVGHTVRLAREHGCRVGLALNATTPLSALDAVLEDLDLVLLIWPGPGSDGGRLAPAALRRLRTVRERIDLCGRDIALSVDGGVETGNAGALVAAGADTLVAGGALFGADDWTAAVAALKGVPRRPHHLRGPSA